MQQVYCMQQAQTSPDLTYNKVWSDAGGFMAE